MTDIASIGHSFAHGQPGPVARPGEPSISGVGSPPARPGNGQTERLGRVDAEDRLELSGHARFLERMHQLPEIRQGLVDRVRGQIADGTYETPERLAVAIDRLVDDLGAEA